MIKVTSTINNELKIIKPQIFEDERGFFMSLSINRNLIMLLELLLFKKLKKQNTILDKIRVISGNN